MKKENLILLSLTVFTTILAGCGRNYSGTYTGTETISLNSVASNGAAPITGASIPTVATMTLTVNHNSGNLLTGTWQSQGQTGNFTGTAGGDSITGVMLMMTGVPTTNQQGYGQMGMYGQVGMQGYGQVGLPGYGQIGVQTPGYNPALMSGQCNTFTGNLNLTPNNQITGSLNVVQTAAQLPQQGYGMAGSYTCSGTRSVNATKIN